MSLYICVYIYIYIYIYMSYLLDLIPFIRHLVTANCVLDIFVCVCCLFLTLLPITTPFTVIVA